MTQGKTIWLRMPAITALIIFLAAVFLPASLSAQSVSQAYTTDGNVQRGMIVMLDPKDSTKVIPLTNKRDNSMQGIVVAANDTSVSLGADTTKNQVYIAAAGKYNTLVSTQNGPIKKGDIISISALDGIGMKADAEQTVILGRALSEFNGKDNSIGAMNLKTSAGKRGVSIGLVQVDIGISHNPLAASVTGPPVPSFLKKAGNFVAGKPVSTIRLYVSLGVLVVTMIMASSLLYGGVRNSLISIGRNPLAKKSIIRGLIQVIVLGLMVFVLGLFAIYLLLRL